MITPRTRTVAAGAAVLAFLLMGADGCEDADVASDNVSKAADNFEVLRRIVFMNGITDQYMLEVQGYCSITDEGHQLEVICKTGPKEYKKHFLGLSDNVTYFIEQLEGVKASDSHYRVTFKPSTIVPDVDVR